MTTLRRGATRPTVRAIPTIVRRTAALLALPAAYVAAQWLLRERQPGPVELVAHRGGAATAPENTLAAFRAAAAAGVLSWELDVQQSRDAELVVFHDDTLDRTSTGSGPIGDYSYVELARLDAGGWFGERWRGERIPTLREVIALAQEVDARLLIELKSPERYPGIEERVVDLLARTGFGARCMILSFDPAALARVHALDPALGLDLNYVGRVFGPLPPVPGLRAIGPEWHLLAANPARVRAAHAAGHQVYTWTANSPQAFRLLRALGVDGIISDRLDLLSAER
jgi:glycerophosphoryl diester phosphodiesterase